MTAGLGPLFDARRSATRERQRGAFEKASEELIDALLEDLASTNLLDKEICDRSGTDPGHFSRVKAKTAHPSQSLVAFAVDHSRIRPARYLVVLNAIGECEPIPKPPPDVSAVFEAYRDVLADMQLDDVVREKVERRLSVSLAPGHATREG